ncbi:lysoplasmalogenase family protein [Tsuneonella amylolytica]|uniref:lysoplasmalogenase family protein n=1 Tax=Tsuneonella amylolytica TaxID=2338327 RepID=UPI000EAA3E0B|nr:lysoplasmalogenase family protein [Tsuneonella amylolytica]
MPKRTLIEHRPWLLLSLASAIGYFALVDSPVGGLFVVALKGMSAGALAIYALRRRVGASGTLLAIVMALGALGDVAMDLWGESIGGPVFLAGHLVAIALYLRHRRPNPARTQTLAGAALLLGTPIAAWLLSGSFAVGLYGLGLGAMAGSAWISRFGRYRVGLGAVLFVASDLLIFARMGGVLPQAVTAWLVWPLYYAGQLLIATGVISKLRAKN